MGAESRNALNTPESGANLIGWTEEEMVRLVRDIGEPDYRGRQLYHAIYAKKIFDFESMTDLSRSFRRKLAQRFHLSLCPVRVRQESGDGTVKMLLSLQDREMIECVYIPEARRDTLCISSQVGCAVGCTFCATATLGLHRNLTAGEIVSQPLYAMASGLLRRPAFNIVMMGMGEPLHNFDQVARALEILCNPAGMALSHRKITLSTSGVVPGIRKLARLPVIPNLAVSLNAADDRTRSAIMPINRRWNLQSLLDACREFPLDSRRRITFEYVLLGGVNDSEEDARRLVPLLRGLPSKINLIAWNYNPGLDCRAPGPAAVARFREVLEGAGLSVFLRKPRGVDIFAACGQLALQAPVPVERGSGGEGAGERESGRGGDTGTRGRGDKARRARL